VGQAAARSSLTDVEILSPLPELPSFPEDIAVVRDRARKMHGRCAQGAAAKHPAIARLIGRTMALYEDEKAQGTELPPIIGALREYVELEEVRSIPPIRKTRKIACPKTICFAGIVVIGMIYTEII
jgi:hypothetical protein